MADAIDEGHEQAGVGVGGGRRADLLGLAAYLISCTIIVLFGEALRRSRRRADLHHDAWNFSPYFDCHRGVSEMVAQRPDDRVPELSQCLGGFGAQLMM